MADESVADVLTPEHAVVPGNGAGAADHLPETRSEAEGAQAEERALFWQQPLSEDEELTWFVPPLPHTAAKEAETEGLLEKLCASLDRNPRRAWMLRWMFRTRASAARDELEAVEAEVAEERARLRADAQRDMPRLDARIRRLREREETLEARAHEALEEFADAAASAGLDLSPPVEEPPPRSKKKEEPDAAPPSSRAEQIEQRLMDASPSAEEMAGRHGVAPARQPDLLSRVLRFSMLFLAPLVAGFMLAICLGTLVGIVDLETLQRADSAPQLLLCAALGFVIVYLMGEIYHGAVAMVARNLETPAAQPQGHAVPVMRGAMAVAALVVVAVITLGAAEVTAEGLGIRQLHNQQVMRQQRLNAGAASARHASAPNMPLGVYMLIGLLISGPYLLYKGVAGWHEHEERRREAWLEHRQSAWMYERRSDPALQRAIRAAYALDSLEASLGQLRAQLEQAEEERSAAVRADLHPDIQARRRAARAAAVGEAARLQQTLEQTVEALEPMSRDGQRPDVRAREPAGRR